MPVYNSLEPQDREIRTLRSRVLSSGYTVPSILVYYFATDLCDFDVSALASINTRYYALYVINSRSMFL